MRFARFVSLLEPIDAESVRGLPRLFGPGCAVHMDHRVAYADVWLGRDGRPVVRFSTGTSRHWFRFMAKNGSRLLENVALRWNDLMVQVLADWLYEEIDSAYD